MSGERCTWCQPPTTHSPEHPHSQPVTVDVSGRIPAFDQWHSWEPNISLADIERLSARVLAAEQERDDLRRENGVLRAALVAKAEGRQP